MSQYSEIMQQLDDIKVQNAWLVKAVKTLLERQFGIPKNFDLGEPDDEEDLELEDYEGNVIIEDEPDDMSQFEHIAVRPQPKAKKCNHGHQVLVDGVVRCARCGHALSTSGLVRTSMLPNGQIAADPHPPQWATDHSPGASSKNPGGPMVPHDVG